MKSKQTLDSLGALRGRYGIEVDAKYWESREVPGGVGLPDEVVASLALAARRYDDRSAVAYEMESSNKEFAPLTVSLDQEGFDTLRRSMLSHFDLVLVPPSKKWALVLSHELDGILLGPEHFLAKL
ncbi:hypothetical protein GCM10027321_31210 [Massilia terrae]|uniref:Uncharacterized protein n=1 Tax=Massilia terrae TaxID=1811224 RepID=A0ABT2CTV8_9BURK|nr:hypothetical protein [Massilia terrae]MCS0656543.1 hypothetical protein [Massilia terrae]